MGCGHTLLLHPKAGGMHSDIPTLQRKLGISRQRKDRLIYTNKVAESEFVRVKNLVRGLGFEDNFDWVSGVDPNDAENQRVVFAATINGHRVKCAITYNAEELWDADRPELVMDLLGKALRKDIAFHASVAYREERPFIYQAIAMYHPRLPFFLAYLWWRLRAVREWIKTHW